MNIMTVVYMVQVLVILNEAALPELADTNGTEGKILVSIIVIIKILSA